MISFLVFVKCGLSVLHPPLHSFYSQIIGGLFFGAKQTFVDAFVSAQQPNFYLNLLGELFHCSQVVASTRQTFLAR